MTAPILKLNVVQRHVIKTRANVIYPARVVGRSGIAIDVEDGAAYFDLDYSHLVELSSVPAADKLIAVADRVDGSFNVISLATLIATGQTMQVVTAGDFIVQPSDGLIVVNKTSGVATAGQLPDPVGKIGKVKIVDFKGDSGTNNITMTQIGAGKFNGNQSSWVIGEDGASVVFDPVPGLGYAV